MTRTVIKKTTKPSKLSTLLVIGFLAVCMGFGYGVVAPQIAQMMNATARN